MVTKALTCKVDIRRVKFNNALGIVVFQNDNRYRGDVPYGWGLITLEAIFSHGEVQVTAAKQDTQ